MRRYPEAVEVDGVNNKVYAAEWCGLDLDGNSRKGREVLLISARRRRQATLRGAAREASVSKLIRWVPLKNLLRTPGLRS